MPDPSPSRIALASYAVSQAQSKGRVYPEEPPTYRNEFQRDRDRIVHSAAFRRLEHKTQVFLSHEDDRFRNRLTHSIEVTQIGRTAARALHLNEDLVEAICLAHDLGHTPFGHAGQSALNECTRDYGGFEHNLQSLRVVDVLEEKYAAFSGLNLTFETREGILKHCAKNNAKGLGELGRRFLEGTRPSLEAQIANISDEIAYNNHDIDDGLRSGLLELGQLMELEMFANTHNGVRKIWPNLAQHRVNHEVVRRMIDTQVTDLIETSKANIAQAQPGVLEDVRQAGRALIGLSPEMHDRHVRLKQFLFRHLYRHYRVIRMTSKAERAVKDLFNAYMEEPDLLPPVGEQQARKADSSEQDRVRAITDYIASMTDRNAIIEHQRIFSITDMWPN